MDLRPPNLIYSETGTPEVLFLSFFFSFFCLLIFSIKQEILKRSGLTKKWQQGQISNFDYLMQLNTIAGE